MAEYHIIGGDGREYGPYSEDEIKQLMADGRLKASSGVRVDDGKWKPYSAYPELSESMLATSVRMSASRFFPCSRAHELVAGSSNDNS